MNHGDAAPSTRHASPDLSSRARAVWGKSFVDKDDRVLAGWLPVYQHLDDTAAVAERLWTHWVPDAVKRVIAQPFGGDVARAGRLYAWLAGQHDVGKASPAFAIQVPELANLEEHLGLFIDPAIKDNGERTKARHEVVGYIALRHRLEAMNGCETRAEQYASVLAAHHGRPPDNGTIRGARSERLTGSPAWSAVREEFMARADAAWLTPGDLEAFAATSPSHPAEVLLSSLVIVADWIASSEHFPPVPLGRFPEETTEQRVERAWAELDLPRPWRPSVPEGSVDELFAARFSLPAGAAARPAQRALVEAARTITEPSMLILEAEMGSGKTEAALTAAEILAARFGLGGVFVALPTQATADGMFDRLLDWAGRLGLDTPENVYLAHGKNRLNETYDSLARAAYFRAVEQQERPGRARPGRRNRGHGNVVAHHWFSSPKRGPLAPFVVGTIDQVLFTALRARHFMLRHLAVAGKVLVIDEAHAYSTFMNQYLERTLHWAAAYGTPVIVLSATLPAERRASLVKAYDSGRAAARRTRMKDDGRHTALRDDIGYPAITVSGDVSSPAVIRPEGPARPRRRVELEWIEDTDAALIETLRRDLRDGGCAVVIRNTVRTVQETARALSKAFGDENITVAHAQFIALERAEKDRQLLHWFGRPGGDADRPPLRIVVASQVVEQSLDIDFDVMVTDIAPVDLVLQRSGRLHRHQRGPGESQRPAPLRAARLYITGVDAGSAPPQPSEGTRVVYDDSILYRTLAVLQNRETITLPDDIPTLVQAVYREEDQLGPADWQDAMAAAARKLRETTQKKRRTAMTYRLHEVEIGDPTLIGMIQADVADPDTDPYAQATVRDGDETLEVLVLQRDEDGILRTPATLPTLQSADIPIPLDAAPDRALARVILGSSLRLPSRLCRGKVGELITELEIDFNQQDELQSWNGSRELRDELVLVLDHVGDAELLGCRVHYSGDYGLEIVSNE